MDVEQKISNPPEVDVKSKDNDIPEHYSFEKKKKPSGRNKNILVFKERLGIDREIPKEHQELIHTFWSQNMHQIQWYKNKIEVETKYVERYNKVTIAILVGVPLFAFASSLWAASFIASLDKLEIIMSAITLVITSILGLHKAISAWIDKRKFRSLFYQASADLKKILYTLESEYKNKATSTPGFEDLAESEKAVLSPEFVNALKKAITDSRDIVAVETKAYFDAQSSPSFDIAGTLKSSASSAKELFGALKGGNFKVEEMRARAEEKRLENKAVKSELEGLLMESELLLKKDEILENKASELSSQPETDENTAALNKILDEQEKLQDKYAELQIRIAHLRGKLQG